MALVIDISVANQSLTVRDPESNESVFSTKIATAKNGTGQVFGSEQTPLGQHRIRAKIGAGEAINTVFVGRRPTGERYSKKLAAQYPKRDWILTRIMWLCGEELNHNRLGNVDTQARYIYIHGAPDTHEMGIPSSHGCIKMTNEDVINLFDLVPVGTKVQIHAD